MKAECTKAAADCRARTPGDENKAAATNKNRKTRRDKPHAAAASGKTRILFFFCDEKKR